MLNQSQYHELVANLDANIFNVFLFVAMGIGTLYPARNILRRFAIPINFRFTLPLILGIALLLRIPHMGESLWYDETFSAGIAQMRWDDLWVAVRSDVHPPAFYIILWNVGRVLGYGEWAMRVPALVMGLISIGVMYRLVWVIIRSKKHAETAALIMAILPAHIEYSTEARGYMLLLLLVLLGVLSLVEFRPLLFVSATMLLPLTHAYGYIYLFLLAVLWVWGRKAGYTLLWMGAKKSHALAIVPGIIAALVWLPCMVIQSLDVSNGFWLAPLTPQGIPRFLIEMTVGSLSGELALAGVYIPTMGIILLSILHNRKWLVSRRGIVLFSVMFGVPLVVALISFVWKPIYLSRALFPCAMLSIVLWAMLLEGDSPMRNLYRMVFIPSLILSTIMTLSAGVDYDYRQFFTQCEGTDYTFATSTATGIIALYYSPSPVLLWTQANDLNQYLSPSAKRAFGFRETVLEDLRGDLCVPMQINPHVGIDQFLVINRIFAYPHTRNVVVDESPLYQMIMYRVQVP